MMTRSMFFAVSFALAGLTACSDNVTTPTSEHGWQVVVQAENVYWGTAALSAIRTDVFAEFTVNTVDFINGSAVYDLESPNDTIWVGYGVFSNLLTENFQSFQVTWSFSGSITGPSTNKMGIGTPQSFYELYSYDDGGNQLGSLGGSHPLSVEGDNFLFTELLDNQGSYVRLMVAVVLRPIVCRQFVAQKITSQGISEVQTDGVRSISSRHDVPTMSVTCNLSAPAAILAQKAREEVPSLKLADRLRQLQIR